MPERGEAGGGGGGDCSLKCPPPVEGGSEAEEAQTENTKYPQVTRCDKILILRPECWSHCSRWPAPGQPGPPPCQSPGLSGRRRCPRWQHCSPWSQSPHSPQLLIIQIIQHRLVVLRVGRWQVEGEWFSQIFSSVKKKPANCL